ncbi:hypothetical protein FMJ40_21185 [Klebsiella variicola]|nr:hypothetical protein [Klebsiella quasipneumoniae]MBZ6549799.1 hypothetical protein [Klebsiella variicola]HBQ3200671.1 hypothetical protein [Klebsiella variicola subsp. variicola]HBQ4092348.1 hypothetical protein [Klebsiella pneumoniae]MBZ6574291.1 hypothetical protein [Klebsiella variicola]
MADEKKFLKKSPNCVDEYADAFGYSSSGEAPDRIGSIAFFKDVTLWPSDGGNDITIIRHNMATIRMPEPLMLKLAQFIVEQHERSISGQKSDEQ